MDPYEQLGLIHNPDDDTLVRLKLYPCITTEAHNSLPNQTIFTKDIPVNPTNKTWFRLFTPVNPPPNTKLPLVVYFHGAGFIMYSASSIPFHDFCAAMASELSVVVLSLDYRLAPEHRLPAAYDDAVEALLWIQNQALSSDDNMWKEKDIVDFSKCYVMGSSSGGNMVYQTALRVLCLDLQPLVIRGYIIDHPAFGGVERSGSELRLAEADKDFTLAGVDLIWELALPKGSNRDHEYCNALVDGSYKDKIGMLGKVYMNTCTGDLMVDYEMEFVKMLMERGVEVVTRVQEGGYHTMDFLEPDKAKLCDRPRAYENIYCKCGKLARFMTSCTDANLGRRFFTCFDIPRVMVDVGSSNGWIRRCVFALKLGFQGCSARLND